MKIIILLLFCVTVFYFPATLFSDEMSDSQRARNFNGEYKKLYNSLKRTHVSKFVDPVIVSDLRKNLEILKHQSNSFNDPEKGYVKQCKKNYEQLESWFLKKVASAEKQNKGHVKNKVIKVKSSKKIETVKVADEKLKPLDYQNKRALGFFNKDYNRYLDSFNDPKPSQAKTLNNYIQKLENRLSKLTMKQHPEVMEASERLELLKTKLKLSGIVQEDQSEDWLSKNSAELKKLDYAKRSAFERGYRMIGIIQKDLDKKKKMVKITVQPKPGLQLETRLDDIMTDLKKNALNGHKLTLELSKKIELLRLDIKKEEKRELELFSQADKVGNIKNYPDFQKDLDWLHSVYKEYNERNIFRKGNEQLAQKLMSSYENDKSRCAELRKKYSQFMKSTIAPVRKTSELTRKFGYAEDYMEKFSKARKEYMKDAAPDIENALLNAKKMLDQAIREKRTAWFKGGLNQKLSIAGEKIEIFASVEGENSPKVKELRSKFELLKKTVENARGNLSNGLLESQKMPEDKYSGNDKQEILTQAVEKWENKYSSLKVLSKGISMRKWDRKTEWRKESLDPTKKYKVDFSEIQVWILVKTSEEIASSYIVELSKDHMKNDTFKVYVPDINGNVFKTDMLLKNVK
ncbi:hypothetical protein KAJ27_07200 [bacterium]|nr:hypothetical protein [bacterium]